MDTVETQAGSTPSAETVYDGFMSYSHSADDLLAPRLQTGLQRFAKPWWKRRAMRIFRDEASLSANPHLWASIVDAMDGSDWLVLLLSRAAAESEWVNREIEYWLEHKDRDRIIPVVTDGEFAWVDGEIAGDAVPSALHGAFADEPRSVDLRFARTEEQLDLNNASFRAAVADIASAIRDIPKDELESEEVRQHRRTVRTAWAGALVVMAFAFLAGVAAVYANGQRITAEENEAEADAQRQIAQEQTEVAEQQTEVAEQLADEARADALAATSIAQLDIDPELSLLLALESFALQEQPEGVNAMHQALQRNRTAFQISAPESTVVIGGGATGGISPDGTRLAIAGHGPTFELWPVGATEPAWIWKSPLEGSVVLAPRFTTDGEAVVVVATPEIVFDPLRDPVDEEVIFGDESLDRLFVLDAETGDELRSIDIPACPWMLGVPPLTPHVDLSGPIAWATCAETLQRTEVGLLDPQTGSFTALTFVGTGDGQPTTDLGNRYLAAASGGPGQVIDLSTNEVVFDFAFGLSTVSPDGSTMLFDEGLLSLDDNELLWSLDRVLTRGWFSADGELVYGTSIQGAVLVFDAETGEVLFDLVGQNGHLWDVSMAEDGGSVASFSTDTSGRVWDLSPILSHGATYPATAEPRPHQRSNVGVIGDRAAIWVGGEHREDELWQITIFDLSTEEPMRTVAGGAPALSTDGSLLAFRSVELAGEPDPSGDGPVRMLPLVGPVHIIDIESGTLVGEIEVPCEQYLDDTENHLAADCPRIAGFPHWQLAFSPDGSLLGMADGEDLAMAWDVETGEVVLVAIQAGNPTHVSFSPVEDHFLFAEVDGRLRIHDLNSTALIGSVGAENGVFLDSVFTPDGTTLIAGTSGGDIHFIDGSSYTTMATVAAHRGPALDLAIGASGTVLASAGADAFVRVWNVANRSLITEIGFDVEQIAGVEFIDDTHLLVTPGFGSEAIVISIDSDELREIARERLTRSFTAEECDRFGIDPCPSLEEIQSR